MKKRDNVYLLKKKWIEKEYNRLSNKNKLLEDVTNSKKVIMEKIKIYIINLK